MYGSQWGSLAAAHSLYKAVFLTTSHARIRISTVSHARIHIRYYKSRVNQEQVLQVTCAASYRAMKSKVQTIITIVSSYIEEIKTSLICCHIGIVTCAAHS